MKDLSSRSLADAKEVYRKLFQMPNDKDSRIRIIEDALDKAFLEGIDSEKARIFLERCQEMIKKQDEGDL